LPRLAIPNLPHYVSQRGHNRQPVFIDDADRCDYLRSLAEAARESRVSIHAYALMADHVDLLATPAEAGALSTMMQRIGRRYVTAFNLRHARRGTLWDGRFRSAVVEPGAYLLAVMCYIEWQPELQGMVRTAHDFRWSTARHHLGLRSDPVVVEHAAYWTLGNTPFEREAAYRNLAERMLTSENLQRMESMVAKGWTLGSETFIADQSRVAGRRLAPLARGRPRKAT
jgi:putative transposase